jgi:hypothetical protein
MKRATMLGVALMLALAVAGVNAISVSATEHEFISSKTGKVLDKTLEKTKQIFKTGVGEVKCETATGEGNVTEGKQTTNKELIKYSNCSGPGGKVSISNADFEFSANGSAKIIEKNILVMLEGLGCHVTIPTQAGPLESVSYTNESGGKVMAAANISGIHSFGSGGSCGTAEETGGSYTGSIEAELEGGGKLEWK